MKLVENPVKRSIASKMRIPSSILMGLAQMGGRIGKAAATIDSWQSRTFDAGHGVYNREEWEK